MKLHHITEQLEKDFSPAYAASWDNVGLLVGDQNQEIRNVLIALDVSDAAVEMAVSRQADLILTHHPLMFRPLSKVTEQDFIGRRVREMIRHEISYYAMHTNFDVLKMAELNSHDLSLEHAVLLEQSGEDSKGPYGYGRVGDLKVPVTLKEFAEQVKAKARLEQIRVYGDLNTGIHRVAVASGAGKSALEDAIAKGAQVLVTGDVDYHTGIDAVARGLAVIDAGHYGTEYCYIPYMFSYMKEHYPELNVLSMQIEQPYRIV